MPGIWGKWNKCGESAAAGSPVAEWQEDWKPPAELARSTPRPVRYTGAGYACVVGAIAMLAGGVALGVFTQTERRHALDSAALLRAEGVTTDARILRTGVDSTKEHEPFVVFEFNANGRRYERRMTIHQRDVDPYPAGAAARVRYVPGNPNQSWLEGYGPEGPPAWVPWFAPIALAIGAVSLSFNVRRQRTLLADGKAAQGRVVSYRRFYTGKTSNYRATYELRTMSGSVYKAKVCSNRRPAERGSRVTMLYNPDNPMQAAAYPMQFVKIDAGFGH